MEMMHDNSMGFGVMAALALVSWGAAFLTSHCEVKGHFSFFTKLILGFSIAAFASDIIIYFVNGRNTSLSGATQGTLMPTSTLGISGGNGMPWDGILNEIYTDLAQYVVIIVGAIAFIIGGLTFMFADGGRGMIRKGKAKK